MPYTIEERARTGAVGEYPEIELIKVNGTPDDKMWNQIMKQHHYLGYTRMIGQRTKYLILQCGKIIGGISFNQASLHLGVRDNHIGWDAEQKKKYLKHVVNNNRFLILPWIHEKNLASQALAKATRQMRKDWKEQYGEEIYAVETFVDGEMKGTCYIASNWSYLGETRGFAKQGKKLVYHGNKKKVFFRIINNRFPKNIHPARKAKLSIREVLSMQLQGMEYDPAILERVGLTVEESAVITEKLISYLGNYAAYFYQMPQCDKFATFIKGIFSPLERKSLEPIALEFMAEEENGPRILQHFFSDAKWDDEGMRDKYQDSLSDDVSEPDGMITVDGCDFPKKGKESVGVARQHCGPLGKTDNCQASVMVGYSGGRGYGLIDRELYLPKKWFDKEYRERYDKCKIPTGMTFKTKNELAIEMIHRVSWRFQAKWVGADSAFGSDYNFLDSIPDRYWYFAEVKKNQQVFLKPGSYTPAYSGKGRRDLKAKPDTDTVKVETIANNPAIPWSVVCLGEGSKGPIIAREKTMRVYESRNGLPGNEIWLYIRELSDGSLKYSISNAPADIPKEELRKQALNRWPIEQCFEECKRDLGMDHYEGRSWTGWYRHILLVFIGHLFLLTIRKTYLHSDPIDDGGNDNYDNLDSEISQENTHLNSVSADSVQISPNSERAQLLSIIAQVEMPPSASGKPILTLPQARDIVSAALTGIKDIITKTLKQILFRIRKAVSAQKSHRKTQIERLRKRVEELEASG